MPTIQLRSVASSLAILTCFACAEGAPEGSANPAKTPDPGVSDPGTPNLAAIWRDHPMFESGSRLRARVLEAGEGAAALLGFRDLQLARDCEFGIAADGEPRCLPVARDGSIYYLDPACTQPVYRQSTGMVCKDVVGPYVTQRTQLAECARDQRTRVYDIGTERLDALAYAAEGGKCKPVGLLDCLHDVTEADPTQFARGTITTEAVGTGFAIEWVGSDDGARAILALRDTVHDVLCSVQPEIRADTCLPLTAAQVVGDANDGTRALFADDGCSDSAALLDLPRDACTPAALAIVREQNECGGSRSTAYELGASTDTAYSKTGSVCSRFFPPAEQKVYALGETLDLETRPVVQLARGGTERLTVRYYAAPDGTPVQYDGLQLYDEKLLRICERRAMTDGSRRCVPVGASASIDADGPFLDAECEEPLIEVPAADACNPMPEYAQRADASKALAAVYELGAQLRNPPAAVYFLAAGECTRRNPKPAIEYHRLGARLDLAVVREQLY